MEKSPHTILEKVEPLISKIGELTKIQRYLIYSSSILVITGIFIYFVYLPKHDEISRLEDNLAKLQEQLKTTKEKAVQLETYQKKMEEAKIQFELAKKTLPEKKEIPSLLSSISQSGRDAGLEFFLFQPNNEVSKGFYAEIPVAIKMQGNYHNLALFYAKVAELPRIVNINNIGIVNTNVGGKMILDISCTAVTYRFIDAESTPKQVNEQKGRKGK